jgi:hypothetical protein
MTLMHLPRVLVALKRGDRGSIVDCSSATSDTNFIAGNNDDMRPNNNDMRPSHQLSYNMNLDGRSDSVTSTRVST